MHWRQWVSIGSILLLCLLSDADAKGGSSSSFSGSGGARGSSFTSGGSSRSPSFSGSSSHTDSHTSPKWSSSYDSAAGKAQSQARSQSAFEAYKAQQAPVSPPRFDSTWSGTRDTRWTTWSTTRTPTYIFIPQRTTVVYHDPYNNEFMRYVTLMWLFNHWESVDHSRWDEVREHELESRIKELEAKGLVRDPNYTEPGLDQDLQYDKAKATYGWTWWEKVVGAVVVVAVLGLAVALAVAVFS